MIIQSNSSRWLLGVALTVLALVVLALVVALVTRPQGATLLPQDTAEGTVQRYLLAIEEDDHQKAYGYLSNELQKACTYDYFRRFTDRLRLEEVRITLEGTKRLNSSVEVSVRVTQFSISSPLRDPIPLSARESPYSERFTLAQVEGDWRFTDKPWPMDRCSGLESTPMSTRLPATSG
jgi:hypothetical protein